MTKARLDLCLWPAMPRLGKDLRKQNEKEELKAT